MERNLRHEFNVHTALDCRSALKIAERHIIDAVVMDVELPDGDGLNLVHDLRERGYTGPVLVASGVATEASVGFARWTSSVQSSILKPYSAKQLIAALKRQLNLGSALVG